MTTKSPAKQSTAPKPRQRVEKPAPSFWVGGLDLLNLIDDAAVVTSGDSSRPVLQLIKLDLAEGRLTARATDSYMLCETWLDIPKMAKRHRWTRYLTPGDRGLLRPLLKGAVQVTIQTEPSSHQVTFSTGSSVTVGTECTPAFPNFAPLLTPDRGKGAGITALSPDFIARFRRFSAAKNQAPVVFDTNCSPTKPVFWKIGDHTTGLIMPVRIDG